jgi:hypothetical protein
VYIFRNEIHTTDHHAIWLNSDDKWDVGDCTPLHTSDHDKTEQNNSDNWNMTARQ